MRSVFGSTDTGLVRPVNQDRFVCAVLSDTLAYAVLCDGMGGENGGHVASQIATSFAGEMLERDLDPNGEMTEAALKGILQSAVAGANALVYETARNDESLSGMGTTMIAAVLYGDTVYAAYVGDSRVYCVSPTRELQLTKDHTVVQMLVDIGEITEQDARNHPKRHYITRAVGVSPTVNADMTVQALEPDDIVMLCSDGLYNYLMPGMLYPMLAQCIAEGTAQKLIDFAKASGGSDNVTAVVAL